MITHSCIPNSGHFENENEGCLEVVSLVDIAKDTPITMCYDWCLKVRLAFRFTTKNFLAGIMPIQVDGQCHV